MAMVVFPYLESIFIHLWANPEDSKKFLGVVVCVVPDDWRIGGYACWIMFWGCFSLFWEEFFFFFSSFFWVVFFWFWVNVPLVFVSDIFFFSDIFFS